jgi:RNA polymerase sigma-70 factor, ECF subfamily
MEIADSGTGLALVGSIRLTPPEPTTMCAREFDSETELLARLRAGELAAQDEFFRTHVAAVMAVARKYLGETDRAADAAQDTFLAAFRAIGTFQATARLGTWLHRIAVNECLMKLRSDRRRRTVSLDAGYETGARRESETLESIETANRVRESIERLPTAFRTIIELRDLQGLDTAETAARLGTTTAVVKTRLHRARHALREILEPIAASL